MNDYNAVADFLNKFSQLTPWVQVAVSAALCGTVVGLSYFLKEIVRVIAQRVKKPVQTG